MTRLSGQWWFGYLVVVVLTVAVVAAFIVAIFGN